MAAGPGCRFYWASWARRDWRVLVSLRAWLCNVACVPHFSRAALQGFWAQIGEGFPLPACPSSALVNPLATFHGRPGWQSRAGVSSAERAVKELLPTPEQILR